LVRRAIRLLMVSMEYLALVDAGSARSQRSRAAHSMTQSALRFLVAGGICNLATFGK
jgi:hypothetical protein